MSITQFIKVCLSLILMLNASCIPQTGAILFASGEQQFASINNIAPADGAKNESPQSSQILPTSTQLPDTSPINLILGRPTANSITLSLYSSLDGQVSITYGTDPGSAAAQTQPEQLQANVPQSIPLTGLASDTTYFYKVIVNDTTYEEHSFHTQRAPGSAFTFTIDADPHNRDPRFNGELYALCMTNALNDHPDFHINLGDTFMTEKIKVQTHTEAESTFIDMRPYFGIIGADTPLFLVNGNHEGEQGWLLTRERDNELPIWSTQLRQLYYPSPATDNFYSGATTIDPFLKSVRDGYYAWEWGNALFIVLDPYWYTMEKPKSDDLNNNWSWTLGKQQYDWLKSTLETSTSEFKFIFIHHLVGGHDKDARGGIEVAPYFEWGGNNADGSYGFDEQRPGWGSPIHQMLVQNRVSAVFHGHDHVFVKQDLDGIVYQEVPQPSITEYNNTRIAADYGYVHGDSLGSSGHLRVSVSSSKVTVEYVRAYLPEDDKESQRNGQVDYSYTIQYPIASP